MEEALAIMVAVAVGTLLLVGPPTSLVLAVLGWRRTGALRRRVDMLEDEVDTLRRAVPAPVTPTPAPAPTAPRFTPVPRTAPAASAPTPAPQGRPAPTPPTTAPTPAAVPRLPPPPPPQTPASGTSWSVERVAVWIASVLGGGLLLLGALLALAIAVERAWLGPAFRVSAGLIGGTLAWGLGLEIVRRRGGLPGAALAGAGLGVLYAVLWAATGPYGLVPRVVGTALMCAVTLAALLTSVKVGTRLLAYMGLAGGLATPLLVSQGSNDTWGLFGYLTLLVAGTLVVAARRKWPELVLATAVGAATLHLSWALGWHAADQVPAALLGALALTLPLAVLGSRDGVSARVARWSAVGLPLVALVWLHPLDPVFVDPFTRQTLYLEPGLAPWWAAGGLLLCLPAAIAARWSGDAAAEVGAGWLGALLGLVAAVGWMHHHTPPEPAIAVMLVAPMLLVGLVRAPLGAAGLLTTAGLGVALGADSGAISTPTLAALLTALAALGAATGMRRAAPRGQAVLMTVGLLAVALPTAIASADLTAQGAPWLAGAALAAILAYGAAPLWRPKAPLAAVSAALVAPALYPMLSAQWARVADGALPGLVPLFVGVFALVGALQLLERLEVDARDGVLALFVAVALFGITAAIPVQLERQWLTVAWALEAVALAWTARRLTHPLLRPIAMALCVAVAVRLTLNPAALGYGDAAGLPVLNWTLYTWGVPAVCLLATAKALVQDTPEGEGPDAWAIAAQVLVVLAMVVGFALVNVQISHAFQTDGVLELAGHGVLQGMARSLAWAAYGTALLVVGLVRDRRLGRMLGFGVVLLAATKVFVVDLWSLDGFVRVGSVLGLAACLLLAAFLFERVVLRRPAQPAAT